jgi:hypothetical protein
MATIRKRRVAVSFQANRLRVEIPCSSSGSLVEQPEPEQAVACEFQTAECGGWWSPIAEIVEMLNCHGSCRHGTCHVSCHHDSCDDTRFDRMARRGFGAERQADRLLLDPVDLPVLKAELERTLALTQSRLDEIYAAEQALKERGLGNG